MKFKSFSMEQICKNGEIENALQDVQQGETENTINSANEAIMIANMLISRINQIVPMCFARGTYAYTTTGDGTEHKFNDWGTRIGIVVANGYYDLTISREQVDDSPRVKIGLNQNLKRQIEKEIIENYECQSGVEF